MADVAAVRDALEEGADSRLAVIEDSLNGRAEDVQTVSLDDPG